MTRGFKALQVIFIGSNFYAESAGQNLPQR
jgi:hypothetical protein